MSRTNALNIYLDGQMLQRALAGKHNFLDHVARAFSAQGWATNFLEDTDENLLRGQSNPAHSLVHAHAPLSPNSLTFRLAYVYPFWKIENTGVRWDFATAHKSFDPGDVPFEPAQKFLQTSRNRLFPWADQKTFRKEWIYIPLQGRLSQKRDHQSMSPLDMVKTTLEAFPDKRFRITLHPRETYSEEDLDALSNLSAAHRNADVSHTELRDAAPGAELVVTQNSSVAFQCLFLEKPVVTFAKSDFHHVTATVGERGASKAFEAALATDWPFAKYLYWFLQMNSINAGRDPVQEQILERVGELGWPVT